MAKSTASMHLGRRTRQGSDVMANLQPQRGSGCLWPPQGTQEKRQPCPAGSSPPCATLSRQTLVALSHSALGNNYAAMENGNKCFLLFVALMWSQISRISERTENSEHNILLPRTTAVSWLLEKKARNILRFLFLIWKTTAGLPCIYAEAQVLFQGVGQCPNLAMSCLRQPQCSTRSSTINPTDRL